MEYLYDVNGILMNTRQMVEEEAYTYHDLEIRSINGTDRRKFVLKYYSEEDFEYLLNKKNRLFDLYKRFEAVNAPQSDLNDCSYEINLVNEKINKIIESKNNGFRHHYLDMVLA